MNPLHNEIVRGNAGCLVKYQGRMLAIRDCKTGKWDIPSGKPEGDETAKQTAERETLEETGLIVYALGLLEDFGGKFYVYEGVLACAPDCIENLTVPAKSQQEMLEIKFTDIGEINESNCRYPSVLARIHALFQNMC